MDCRQDYLWIKCIICCDRRYITSCRRYPCEEANQV